MAPEASKKPKVRFEALFCFSDECYTVFVRLCLVPVPKLPFFPLSSQSTQTPCLSYSHGIYMYVTDQMFVW